MSKKVWISLPLITAAEATESGITGFTKGGLKKELEIETAAFVTKWLMDRDVPFSIDFESATVDRNPVFDLLPRRLQKVLGYKVGGSAEVGGERPDVENAGAAVGGSEVPVSGQGQESSEDKAVVTGSENGDEGVVAAEHDRTN